MLVRVKNTQVAAVGLAGTTTEQNVQSMLTYATSPASSRQRMQQATLYHAFFATALAMHKAVALWRLPDGAEVHGVVDLDHVNRLSSIDFRRKRAGFVFAPFVPGAARNTLLRIDADVICTPEGLELPAEQGNPDRQQRRQHFADAFAAALATAQPGWYITSRPLGRAAGAREYADLVAQAVTFINASGIAKVVVSRRAEQPLPPGFDPVDAFLGLTARHPHAFVSLVSIPGVGTWLGASPETLLMLDGSTLTTMALAGTQRRPEDCPLSAVRWGHKEVLEQEMVSDYVRAFFARTGVRGVSVRGPETVAAANVVHLQTLFEVRLPEEERLVLANRVLEELHPTSAVCGMPKRQALEFILAHEGYDRSFYSGFLGPVHLDGQSSLYVNLRCMQLHAASASLYVGGGITAESDPAAEWRETELKAEAMLAALRAN